MQVAQSELLGIVDDDGIGVGHVDAALNNAGGDQYVVFVIDEIEDHLLQLLWFHLAMTDNDTGIRDFTAYQGLDLINVLDAVVDEENLSVTTHLEVDRLADDIGIEPLNLRLYRITVRWWCRDTREVAGAHQRELQGPGDWRGGHGQRVYVDFQLAKFFLDRDTELLLLVDDEQAQVLELDILADQAMGADDDVDLALFQSFQGILDLGGAASPADVIDLAREIFQAL